MISTSYNIMDHGEETQQMEEQLSHLVVPNSDHVDEVK